MDPSSKTQISYFFLVSAPDCLSQKPNTPSHNDLVKTRSLKVLKQTLL